MKKKNQKQDLNERSKEFSNEKQKEKPKDKICPFMSMRLITETRGPDSKPIHTPSVVKCQKEDCQVWNGTNCGLIPVK